MDIKAEIAKLKKEKDYLIIAHNYQLPEIQEVADFIGDSLALSVEASKRPERGLLFCGVVFMAETAKILAPEKIILIPDIEAGCPMADMIDAERLRSLKAQYPDAVVLCYVNSTAEVKAESDVCCTSANAVTIAKKIHERGQKIIFIPDRNLGRFVESQIPGIQMIIYPGFCPTHNRLRPEHLLQQQKTHPNAEILVHPECQFDVLQGADKVLSTGQMDNYVKNSLCSEFIIGTEEGMIDKLRRDYPDKLFYPALENALLCPNMKKNTLWKLVESLRKEEYQVNVDPSIQARALLPIMAMFELMKE